VTVVDTLVSSGAADFPSWPSPLAPESARASRTSYTVVFQTDDGRHNYTGNRPESHLLDQEPLILEISALTDFGLQPAP
jgi:hypothetical protein